MGGLCGWCGVDLGSEKSRQTIDAMLRECGNLPGSAGDSIYTDFGGLASCTGISATSFSARGGIQAVLIGSPQWATKDLANFSIEHGLAASVIKAYKEQGRNFLSQLHGPFALAVLEPDAALIAIDRIGIHGLSYAVRDAAFVFSTSTGSVASHPRIGKNISPQAILNYFYFYDIPSPGTVYQGVEKLLPAQYIHFRNGRIDKGFYWRLHYNDSDSDQVTFHTEKQRLHDLLNTAVDSIPHEGPTAAFLSGGTDSSTITGVFANTSKGPVDTYSIGFSADGFDEMHYARLAAERFGASTHEYYLKPDDILEAIPLIAQVYDEPFGNESAVPTYFCARRAAEDGVKIMLAGDGGDEIFGGNARYAKQLVFEHYTRLPGLLRKRFIEPPVFGLPGGDAILPVRKLRSYIRQANIPMPERMESYNFIYRQPLEEMLQPGFLSSVDLGVPEAMLRDTYFQADSTHPINRMLHLDMKFTLADNDLRKVSRMCEAAGVEVRYPLLDEAMVEFSATLPPRYKVKGHKLRWFFKESLKDFLPREIIHKSKHGFGLPFGTWALTHAPLKTFVNENLSRFEERGYMRPEYIHALKKRHAEEHPIYYGKMIWIMVMLEQWLQQHASD